MLNQFLATWKTNQGNLLLAFAGLATAMVSAIWYFDLLPDITFVSSPTPRGVSRSVTRQPTLLVLTVLTPKPPEGESISVQFRVQAPVGSIADEADSLVTRQLNVGSNGVDALVVSELPNGTYSAFAFLDLNSNGKLDVSVQGVPTEPYRLSHLPSTATTSTGLEEAEFTLRAGQTTNLRFDFQEPVTENAD